LRRIIRGANQEDLEY